MSKHINRAQAQDIAQAQVPRSRPTDVESDDLRTTRWEGHAIVSRSRSVGGHDDIVFTSLHTGDRMKASGRDTRDHDSGRDDHRRGHHDRDRHDRDRHDRDRHDRGDGTRDQ